MRLVLQMKLKKAKLEKVLILLNAFVLQFPENISAIGNFYHSQQLDLNLMPKCIQHIICYCLDAQLQQKWLWLTMGNFGMYTMIILCSA